jgi:SAM-dependent methyltransferase
MAQPTSILKDLARKMLFIIDPLYIATYKIFNTYSGPIPPMQNRVRVGNHYRIDTFMKGGRRCFEPLKAAILSYQDSPIKDLRILDFGAGCGRSIQFFYPELAELWATDVDASAIDFLRRTYPKINADTNEYDPPTRYASDSFDVVYSVSIWTHLPLDKQIPWLEEIHRILKPQGLALITVLGNESLAKESFNQSYKIGLTPEKLTEEGTVYVEYPTELKSKVLPGIEQSYGVTYHAANYIRKVWGRKFEVLDIQTRVIDDLQDLVVLKKKI